MDRRNRRPLDAAVLFAEAARRFPDDEVVQLLAVESLLIDRKDPVAALGALRNVQPKKAFLRVRHTLLAADALVALGRHEEARGAVKLLLSEVPNDSQLRRKLAELEKSAPRS